MRGPLTQARMGWVAAFYLGGMVVARELTSITSAHVSSVDGPGLPVALCALALTLWQTLRHRQDAGWCLLACCSAAGFGVYLALAPTVPATPGGALSGSVLPALSDWMKAGIDASSLPNHAAYIKSILLGDRGQLPAQLAEDYVRSGLVHILSVSGLHVAFVSYAVGLVSGMVFTRGRLTVWVQLIAVGAYTLACGAAAPVVRSAVMLGVALLGSLAGRRSNSVSSLSIAAILLATAEPAAIASISFQLSFAAVLSLAVLGPVLRANLPLDSWCEGRPGLRHVVDSVIVSVSATLGTLPLLAFHFGRVSLISLLANVVAVPLSGAIVVLGLLQAVVTHAFSPVGRALGATNGMLIDVLNSFVHGAGSVPYSSVTVGAPRVWAVIAAYGFLLWASSELTPGYFGRSRDGMGRVAVAFCMLVLLGVGSSLIAVTFTHPSVTFISVGQGDSTLIESRDGRRVLVDCGPGSFRPGAPDAGARFVLPYLRKRGLRSLDAVILTHNDLDHIGGAEAVLKGISVRALFRGPGGSESASSQAVWALAAKMRVPTRVLSRGDVIRLGRGVVLKVISPSRDQYRDVGTSDNNRSVVIEVISPGRTVLLTGDLEVEGEQRLVDFGGQGLDVDVLKVGHHGSHSSSGEQFLSLVSPDVCVVSVGRNRYGHPHAEIITRLERSGARVLRTDKNGNIRVDLTGDGAWIHSEGKGRFPGGFDSRQGASRSE